MPNGMITQTKGQYVQFIARHPEIPDSVRTFVKVAWEAGARAQRFVDAATARRLQAEKVAVEILHGETP